MKKVLHLGYHYVREDEAPGLNCNPKRLKLTIRGLLCCGYHFLTCGEIVSRIKQGKPLPERCASLSFDDGLKDQFTTAFPILREFSIPATFFYNTCALEEQLPPVIGFQILINQLGPERMEREILPEAFKGTPYLDLLDPERYDICGRKVGEPEEMRRIKWMFNHWPSQSFKRDRISEMFSKYLGEESQERFAKEWFISDKELLEMSQAGMEIASHSHTHPDFSISGLGEIISELDKSSKTLSLILGKIIETFGWPFGGQFRKETQKLVNTFFSSAWNFCPDLKDLPENPHQNLIDIPRIPEANFILKEQ